MDFYKKISKPKDISAILNEKEYKCASLNAITNEAVKENNKERLKVLIEEINEHLQDLGQLKENREPKIKQRCENLIKQYEECLYRILHPKPLNNFLPVLNEKYEKVHQLSNIAIQKSNEEYLKQLAEKIKSHIEVLKEMPEIKSGKNLENREEFLQLLGKNEELLHTINTCLNSKKISAPIAVEVPQKTLQGDTPEQENPPPILNKIGLNEVEEKLKIMRQKRLSRLSTFVDQQSKLSEQRSRENSPKNLNNFNNSKENLGTVSESEEIETAIKSIQSSEVGKPATPLRTIVRENIANAGLERKVFLETEKGTELKLQSARLQEQTNEVAAVAKRVATSNLEMNSGGTKKASGCLNAIQVKEPVETEITKTLREEIKPKNKLLKEETKENGENTSSRQGTLTRSFAERHIDNAKIKESQSEKSKVSTNQSNSAKKTPPTQFKKIFNTFNACVVGTSNYKSIEDLPKEVKNYSLEQESKTAHLKSAIFEKRLKTNSDSNTDLNHTLVKDSYVQQVQVFDVVPPPVPKKTKAKYHLKSEPDVKFLGEKAVLAEKNLTETQGIVEKVMEDKTPKTENAIKAKRRLSLDFDSIITPESKPLYLIQPPSDLIIAVKTESNPLPDSNRCLFSTFRSSTDSIKRIEQNSEYNYAKNADSTKTNQNLNENTNFDNDKCSSGDKAFKSLSYNCAHLVNLLKNISCKNLANNNFTDKVKELNLLLKDVRKEIENGLDIEFVQRNENFTKILNEIDNIEKTINTFRGLKRDEDYLMLDKRLAKLYVDIDQVRPQSLEERNRQIDLTERLQEAYKKLEDKVKKNEEILKIILEEQVKMLGEKYTLA